MPAMDSDDAELVFLHRHPRPDSCDVCLYVQQTEGADQMLEHTATRFAIGLMVQDLGAEGHPMRMEQLHQRAFGFPEELRIEPRHWFWALLVYPWFVIGLDSANA